MEHGVVVPPPLPYLLYDGRGITTHWPAYIVLISGNYRLLHAIGHLILHPLCNLISHPIHWQVAIAVPDLISSVAHSFTADAAQGVLSSQLNCSTTQ